MNLVVLNIIVFIVSMLHLLRVILGWNFIIGGLVLPMWVSVLGFLVTGYFAVYLFKINK